MPHNFFRDYNPILAEALAKQGITAPTEIQQRAMPLINSGRDIIFSSETGTGKTLCYLLPLFDFVSSENKNVQALVIVPTYELAVQIFRQCETLNSNLPPEHRRETAFLIGGANIGRQIEQLKKKPRIAVGTAGRILELIERKKLTLHFVKKIILDEGDRLLEDKSAADIERIIKMTQRDRQLILASATVSEKTMRKAREIMKSPEVIDIKKPRANIPENIEHFYVVCKKREKLIVLRKLLRFFASDKSLVFANSAYSADIAAEKLNYDGITCCLISSQEENTGRKNAMTTFREGGVQVLIATELASRGLDIPDVTSVFNIDAPADKEGYLHRAGRTGRAGAYGRVISLVTENELIGLKKLEKELGFELKKLKS